MKIKRVGSGKCYLRNRSYRSELPPRRFSIRDRGGLPNNAAVAERGQPGRRRGQRLACALTSTPRGRRWPADSAAAVFRII